MPVSSLKFARTLLPALAAGAVALLLNAPQALAAEEAHVPTAIDLVYGAINLSVLLGVIFYFARKPVARFFRNSAGEQRGGYDDAVNVAQQTKAEVEAQKKKIAELEGELHRMLEDARGDAAEEREQLERDAAATGERIKTQAGIQVAQEMNKARLALREQLADETVRLAGQLLSSRLDDDRRNGLVAEYISQLEQGS